MGENGSDGANVVPVDDQEVVPILSLVTDYGARVQSLWTTYSAVTVGLIVGFFGTDVGRGGELPVRVLAAVGFAFFSRGNYVLLQANTKALWQLSAHLHSVTPRGNLSKDLFNAVANTATKPRYVRLYHWPIDLCVLGCILFSGKLAQWFL